MGQGIPATDQYSFAAVGQPFLYQAWLSGAILAAAYSLGGPPLIVFINAFMFVIAYCLLLHVCVWRGGSLRIAAAAMFAGFLLSVENWAVRPQSFALLLFALTWWLLWRYSLGKGRPRALVLLPLVMAVWANIHGTFPLGLVLQGIFVLGLLLQKLPRLPVSGLPDVSVRPVVLAGFMSLLATLATPYGPGLYGYLMTILENSAIRAFIVEWQPTTLAFAGGKALLGVAALTGLLVALTRKLPDAPTLLGMLVFGFLASQAVRNVVWLGFIVAPYIALLLAAAAPGFRDAVIRLRRSSLGTESSNPVFPLAVVAFLAVLFVVSVPWLRPSLPLPEERRTLLSPDTPLVAARALQREGVGHRIFADMQYASYILWELPESKVLVDPRIELYPYSVWEQYGTISDGLQTERLDAASVDALLLNKERQPALVRWATEQRSWRLVYEDSRSSAWVLER